MVASHPYAPLPLDGCAETRPGTAVGAARPAAATLPRRWQSTELLGTGQEAEIQHGKALYRLRLTSLGKLILVK